MKSNAIYLYRYAIFSSKYQIPDIYICLNGLEAKPLKVLSLKHVTLNVCPACCALICPVGNPLLEDVTNNSFNSIPPKQPDVTIFAFNSILLITWPNIEYVCIQ